MVGLSEFDWLMNLTLVLLIQLIQHDIAYFFVINHTMHIRL